MLSEILDSHDECTHDHPGWMYCSSGGSSKTQMLMWDGMQSDPSNCNFFDQDNISNAFGFVNPDSEVRSIHLILAFAFGNTNKLLGPSFVRQERGFEGWNFDWRFFYVDM